MKLNTYLNFAGNAEKAFKIARLFKQPVEDIFSCVEDDTN